MVKKPRILIAGGGIGALAASLALLRRGFEVQVFEQADTLREVGAGIQVSANGMAILEHLGIADELLTTAVEPEQRIIRMWNSGESWTAFNLGDVSVKTYGYRYVTVYRPDLQGVLAEAVRKLSPDAIHLGRRVVGCSQDDDGVTLHFPDGLQARGDALVGADGIHSVIRAALHGADKAEFTGLVAWRGAIPTQNLPAHLTRNVSSNWIGPGRHVVQYPMHGGKLMNFVGIVERSDWRDESWNTPGTQAEMRADFAGWHSDIQEMISAIPQPYVWALKLRELLPAWSSGKITLLGDACHATLPFLAQGAVMAMEDGVMLARAFEMHGEVSSAFNAYEAVRQPRTARVVRESAETTKKFHNPALSDAISAKNFIDREWSAERLAERYDWIYRYNASTAEI